MKRYAIVAAMLVAIVAAIVEAQAIRSGASSFDAGAARQDLSNVVPAIGRSALNAEQAGSVATHAADTSSHGKAVIAGIEDIPTNASFTLSGLGASDGNATFSHNLDLGGLTINGEDILGDIQTALTEIIGS